MSSFTLYAQQPVEKFRKSDPLLLISIILLIGVGLLAVFVITPIKPSMNSNGKYGDFIKQLVSFGIGLAVLIVFATVKIERLRKLVPVFYIGSIVFSLLLFTKLGTFANGATRWLSFGRMSMQPSELCKFAVVFFLANIFSKQKHAQDLQRRVYYYPLIGMFLIVILVLLQKDLSTAFLIFICCLMMFFVCGGNLKWLIPCAIIGIPSMIPLIFTSQYRTRRLLAFLKPENADPNDTLQQLASENAISSGGFWGKGFGTGIEAAKRVPEVRSDYIFSGWTEAVGLFGVILFFLLLGFFIWRAMVVVTTCPDEFASFASFGFVCFIGVQTLINLGVVCGCLPTTGLPLPFFSLGGTSLVVSMGMCGFLINASRCTASTLPEENVQVYEQEKIDFDEVESFNGVVVEEDE